MGGATATLERIDTVLSEVPAPLDPYEECYRIIDELPEEGINILPTAIDEADMCLASLADTMLPPVARGVGMPAPVVLGQRSPYIYEI